MLRILDIDLDLFQTARAQNCPFNNKRRLDGDQNYPNIKPWSESQLVNFLSKCGLSKEKPLKVFFIENHDEIFYILRKMILNKQVTPKFEIYHADAHADLGCGDASSHYILSELLHQPMNMRIYPKLRYNSSSNDIGDIEGLSEGNFLYFMIACSWLKKIVYIHHPDCFDDIPLSIFPNKIPKNGKIKLPVYSYEQLNTVGNDPIQLIKNNVKANHYEPEVIFERIECNDFENTIDFDIAFVCKSLTHTLSKTDDFIPIIKGFIKS